MVVRLADRADAESLLPLARAFHGEDGHPLTQAGEDALRGLLADPGLGLILAAERKGAIVGYGALCFGYSIEMGGRDAFIDDLYLIPTERGGGLGAALMQALALRAAAAGCAALHLEVMAGSRAAPFYRRLGFRDRGSALLTRPL